MYAGGGGGESGLQRQPPSPRAFKPPHRVSESKVSCVGLKRLNAILLVLMTNADSLRGGGASGGPGGGASCNYSATELDAQKSSSRIHLALVLQSFPQRYRNNSEASALWCWSSEEPGGHLIHPTLLI